MSKVNDLLNYDAEMNTLFSNEVWKQLDTGRLIRHYRCAGQFIVRETVMLGFKKRFIDSVDVFTTSGCHVGKMYRIREVEWSPTASKEIVSRLLSEYLYSKRNLVLLDDYVTQLFETLPHIPMTQLFIEQHEK